MVQVGFYEKYSCFEKAGVLNLVLSVFAWTVSLNPNPEDPEGFRVEGLGCGV